MNKTNIEKALSMLYSAISVNQLQNDHPALLNEKFRTKDALEMVRCAMDLLEEELFENGALKQNEWVEHIKESFAPLSLAMIKMREAGIK